MKNYFTILIFAISGIVNSYTQSFNQDPGNPNLDFSSGDFTNWQLSWGARNNPDSVPGAAVVSSHVVVNNYGTNWDGNAGVGNLKRVPDGLERVARLGDPAGGGLGNSRSYKLKYNITVHAAYPVLFINIASIMDKTHSEDKNTHYKFAIKNALGNFIPTQPCTGIELAPSLSSSSAAYSMPSIGGYNLPANASGNYAYQPWESAAIDLSAYAGQTLSLELEHYDCYMGYHGSYTYFSAGMRKPADTFYYCRGAASVIVNPYIPRFKSYLWSTGDTTSNIVVTSPMDGTSYTCAVSSYNGCTTLLTYVLKEIKATPDFTTTGGNICSQIQFYSTATTNKGYITDWRWTFGDPASDAANTDTIPDPLHTYPAPGDYTVSLTVTDTNGCSNTITKVISVSPASITARIRLPDTTCVYNVLVFEDITTGSPRRAWVLDGVTLEDTAGVIRRAFSRAGMYEITLIVTGNNGCPDTLTQPFEVHGLPEAGIETSPYTASAPITAPSFTFRGLQQGASAYLWDFGYGGATGTGEYTKFTYPREITSYIVTVKTYNQYGCFDTASVTVSLTPPDFFVPSAFSPDGDGNNDVFRVINITNQKLLGFSIYNRYGQRIFYTIDPGSGWDGTFVGHPCEAGTYYYVVQVAFRDGTQKMVKGDITLVR